MKVFAIGDLHLSGNPPTKPMDIFGPHWDNHWARIKEHWANNVTDDDIVFLVGDMSWALRLDEAAWRFTRNRIHAWQEIYDSRQPRLLVVIIKQDA